MPVAGPRPNPNQPYDDPSTFLTPNPYPPSSSQPHQDVTPPSYQPAQPSSQDEQLDMARGGTRYSVQGAFYPGNDYGYNGGPSQDEGDISGYGRRDDFYDSNYEMPYAAPEHIPPAPSTIGPWDSASQRSLSLSYGPAGPSTTQPIWDEPSHLRNKPSYSGGLSYIDEEGAYYKSNDQRPACQIEMRGLVDDPGPIGGREELFSNHNQAKLGEYETSPYAYPPLEKTSGLQSDLGATLLFATGLDRLLAMFGLKFGNLPIEQQIERKRHGIPGQRWPVAAWALTAVMTALMVYELVRNYQATGSVIATKPSFNYMIGPSPTVLINIGARFPPCMKLVEAIPPSFTLQCMNDTSSPATTACTISEICGHGGFPDGTPNQSWRFVVPIFLHVGVIHLLVNMVAQISAGAQVEREMGTIPFLMVYFAGGVYGFILGGNFSRPGIPSVGASGALFAINACVLVDLLLHWKYEERPKLKAFLLALEFAVGIAIGYIPNAVDGLAHLGGFAMGLLLGTILYPSICQDNQNRRKYIIWGLRCAALALAIVAFVLTTKNFYTVDPNAACEWCRYLSCIPTSSNNRCSGTGLVNSAGQVTRRSWELL